MKNFSKFKFLSLIGILVTCSLVSSQTLALSPVQEIEENTKKTIEIVEANKKTFTSNPAGFYQSLDKQLSYMLDTESFVKKIMGRHADTSKLNSAQKKELNQKTDRFVRKFKTQLFTTYGTLLLGYSGQKYKVLPLTSKNQVKAKAGEPTVVSQIFYVENTEYKVDYKMELNNAKQWKVTNIRIAGADISKTLNSQFNQAMKKYGNDLDKVIDNWSISPKK